MTFDKFYRKSEYLQKKQQKGLEAVVYRSSRPDLFYKIGVVKNFGKFTGKRLCQSLFFNKIAGLRLLKKRLWHRCFPLNFAKFLRIPFFIEHLRWLRLH